MKEGFPKSEFLLVYAMYIYKNNYSQFRSTRSTKNLCFSFSVKRS